MITLFAINRWFSSGTPLKQSICSNKTFSQPKRMKYIFLLSLPVFDVRRSRAYESYDGSSAQCTPCIAYDPCVGKPSPWQETIGIEDSWSCRCRSTSLLLIDCFPRLIWWFLESGKSLACGRWWITGRINRGRDLKIFTRAWCWHTLMYYWSTKLPAR